MPGGEGCLCRCESRWSSNLGHKIWVPSQWISDWQMNFLLAWVIDLFLSCLYKWVFHGFCLPWLARSILVQQWSLHQLAAYWSQLQCLGGGMGLCREKQFAQQIFSISFGSSPSNCFTVSKLRGISSLKFLVWSIFATTDTFPFLAEVMSDNLGHWPLLQCSDRLCET